jgi:VWFA-related protein
MSQRLAFAVIVAAGMASFSSRPMGAQAPPQPPFKGGVEAVTIDVGVIDAQGRPVGDLGAGDFVVTVAGRPRRVVSATYLGTDASTDIATEALLPPVSTNDDVPAVGRMVVFVVDQTTLDHTEVRQVGDAAQQFFSRLTLADRSALVLMPVGAGIPFTADHARVQHALEQANGLATVTTEVRNLGMEEIRAIASGDFLTLNNVAARECADRPTLTGVAASGQGGAGGGPTGGVGPPSANTPTAFDSADSCTRQIESEARNGWQQLRTNTLASLNALHTVLTRLKAFNGDKIVVLISGGWPLDTRDGNTELQPVANAAADAHAMIFAMFAPRTEGAAERRTISNTPIADLSIRRWPLETLAAMTGGDAYRVDAGAADVFQRLARETSGYYRVGVERETADLDGKARPLTVEVTRRGLKVRAPQRFAARSYAERDVPSRLETAMSAPLPATGLGLAVASYLEANPQRTSQVKVVLVGSISRLQPGDVTLQLALRDDNGNDVATGSQSIGEATSDQLPFSTAFTVPPGRYNARIAVMDSAGVVGSVDHRVDARRTTVGTISTGDLILVRMPQRVEDEAQLILDGLSQNDRLAMQIDLEGDPAHVAAAGVVFEIAANETDPPLIHTEASRLAGDGPATAQTVTDVRLLPPGRYLARARVTTEAGTVATVKRVFVLTPAAGGAVDASVTTDAAPVAAPPPVTPLIAAPPFAVDRVLSSPVLSVFLDRVASRTDAASARPALDRARAVPAADIAVTSDLLRQSPAVGRFLQGVSQLARSQPAPAADEFRTALRASPDFYPAMVYLGACWAAVGNDREAAGAWQTALIKEGDVLEVHLLLIDALQRLGKREAALDAIARARARWPSEPALERRYATASFVAGRYQQGFAALDAPNGADDEPTLLMALQVLYEAFQSSKPIETVDADRERMAKYAERYRALNGPSLALVDAWLAAVRH